MTGSPAYLAPEVASGTGAGTASDVWSLGATLFHVLSGKPAYDVSANMIGGLYKIVHEEPPRLPDAGAFDELLRATMARDPAERWPMERVRDQLVQIRRDPAAVGVTSMQVVEVEDEVEPATDVMATVTESLPPADKPDRTRRSPWPWLLAIAAAVLAVVVVLALTGDDPSDEQVTDEPTSEPTTDEPTDPPSTPAANTRQDITDFIGTYLATVTTDRRAAFAMLTPEFQAESDGFEGYTRFWRTIASASASNIEVDPENLTVTYDVAYRTVSGGSDGGTVSLQLVRQGTDYLIAGES